MSNWDLETELQAALKWDSTLYNFMIFFAFGTKFKGRIYVYVCIYLYVVHACVFKHQDFLCLNPFLCLR